MAILRSILLFFCMLFMLSAAKAQATFSLQVSGKKIYRDDVISVEYTVINGDKVSDFKAPSFSGWNVIEGPSVTNIRSNNNGIWESRVSYSYTLEPAKTGQLMIPGASIMVQGKHMECAAEKITVLNEKNPVAAKQPASQPLQSLFGDIGMDEAYKQMPTLGKNESPEQRIRNNMYIKVSTSKQTCYVGEPVLVTYKLYSAINSTSHTTKQPTFSGCSVIEMTPNELVTEHEQIGGKMYKVFLLRKVQLVPLQAGELSLDLANVETEITFNVPGNQQRTYSLTLKNQPSAIHVNALPEKGKPSGFTGATGKYTIEAHAKDAKIPAGENDTILLTISGNGNIQDLLMPSIKWPADVEHFDAITDEDINKNMFPVTGSKTFQIPIIANKEGTIEIPPIRFSFFNATKGTYETIYSKSINLEVTKALGSILKRDSTIITEDFTTRKYIWIVPAIALIVISILFISGRRDKKKIAAKNITSPNTSLGTNIPTEIEAPLLLPGIDFAAALEMLDNIEENKLFYTKAKELLTQAMQEHLVLPNVSDSSILLNKLNNTNPSLAKASSKLLADCNLGIYSPVSQNREEMAVELKDVIGQLVA